MELLILIATLALIALLFSFRAVAVDPPKESTAHIWKSVYCGSLTLVSVAITALGMVTA